MREPFEIEYENAVPLQTTPCLAWLVENVDEPSARKMIFLTGPDLDDPTKVIEMVRRLHPLFGPPCRIEVSNVTLGSWLLASQAGDAYFNDARRVDSDGMVQVG